jgi:hypothetical protein
MRKIIWTADMVAQLKHYYPILPDIELAERMNIGSKSIVKKAKSLGLKKYPLSGRQQDAISVITFLFTEYSYREMAKVAQVSYRTISRIVKELNLRRTADEECRLRSRSRKALIRLERAHATFGLPPLTRIKVVSNKHRSRLRVKLKSCGYIVLKDDNTIYYLSDFKRHFRREANGVKMGLRFAPFHDTDSENKRNTVGGSDCQMPSFSTFGVTGTI